MSFRWVVILILLSFSKAWSADFIWDENPDRQALTTLQNTRGLKVFWWNIHDGRPAKAPTPDLSKNLLTLINSELAPDILSFAEYQEQSIGSEALSELRAKYPFNMSWSYPYHEGFGLALFSRYPITLTKISALDVASLSPMSSDEQEQYRNFWCGSDIGCTRLFTSFDIDVLGNNIQIVPVHLFDVWRRYSQLNGRIKTAREIAFGKDNPLANQLSRFLNMLNEKLLPQVQVPATIVIGDFNIPRALVGVHPKMYKSLKQNLVEVFSEDTTSFPAKSADERGHYPQMQIDHAFLAGNLQSSGAQILPLKGSDHYPIYMVVSTPAFQSK